MGNNGTLFEKARGARIRGRFQKGLAELETLRKSGNSTTVITANGEVQTNKEAQVYGHDLHLFVMVQILDDTPAVLSLGKLCEEHGYTNEWACDQKPRLTKNGKRIL